MKEMSAIVLCGGKSSRMGIDKATLVMGGETFLQRIVENLSKECEVFLAIGDKEEYDGIEAKQVRDVYSGCGPLAGIQAVMETSKSEIFFVVTCDMPYVDMEVARELLEYLEANPDIDAVVPLDQAGRKHILGAVYKRSVYPYIVHSLEEGNYKVRDVLKKINVKYVKLKGNGEFDKKLININTPTDYYSAYVNEVAESGQEDDKRKSCAKNDKTKQGIPVFSLVAYSGTGKTTFMEKLIPELKRKQLRVAVIKHDAHEFEIDKEGKDSWRITRAGADITGLISSTKAVLMENRSMDASDFLDQITNVDVIITEGYKTEKWPKIMIHRSATKKALPISPSECMAVVSDKMIEGAAHWYGLEDVASVADLIEEVIGK